MTHYQTIEDDQHLEGNADAYYGYEAYNNARSKRIRRLQYIIKKDKDGNPTEISLLENGEVLDINQEQTKGLDRITISHLWQGDPYRFSHKTIKPLGRIIWLAPDLFYWYKKEQQ